ncbi:MAG: AAA family ATPase [Spirochaetaceae bacterium]|jgi:ATP-dependent metalloprotease FtsH|nr:AAA family ATPase [Spirochaetaceae bacterium]
MDMNTAMRFVVKRAMAEKSFTGASGMRPEHIFLGILKLSELSAEEIAPSSSHKGLIEADIGGVKDLLKARGINPAPARGLLRDILIKAENRRRTSEKSGDEETAKLFDRAARIAEEEGAETLTALHFLEALFKDPPETIKVIINEKGPEPPEKVFGLPGEKSGGNGNGEKGKAGSPLSPQERLAQLPGLAERIRHLRSSLMEKVFGQDHAIHEFSESIFGAELLAEADDERRRPRAIFVFAGPPGVGKTFLAEQGAAALGLPYKRFEMSGYADHQSQINLIGLAPSYKDAKPGALTGFVKGNPHCILLFDEIEKAHLNTIQLFLQILDAGNLHDDFLDEDTAFKDTIIIFTTNAGKQLYEGESKANAAGVSRQVILKALETDINPQTGTPYFPAAICSRMATGSTILFNHLKAHDLETICERELERCSGLFEKQYGVKTDAGKDVSSALLFSEGGLADARTLRARTELFFKNEMFKLSGLFSGDSFAATLEKIDGISFTVDIAKTGKGDPNEIQALFNKPDKPSILLFTGALNAARLEAYLKPFTVYRAKSPEEAFRIAGEKDLSLVLLDLAYKGDEAGEDTEPDSLYTVPDGAQKIRDLQTGTMGAFANIPMAADALRTGRFFFRELVERIPELPVYLLETRDFAIDDELLVSFTRAGARGKRGASGQYDGDFTETLEKIAARLYLQNSAAKMAAEQKALYFETAPKISDDKRHINIRLRDLVIKRNINAIDAGEVLRDAEKPDVRFDDVIGAAGAKEELKFFVDFLKNPKKFSAQGIKAPKGVLLYGPPGTGKTLLARAMAGESSTAFIPAAASSFVTMWQGSGPESVRQLFGKARKYAPSVVFIDEIDAIGRKRLGGPGAHGEEMALNALLTEMDGFKLDPRRPVFVLAATNFEIDEAAGTTAVLDPALVRRFDRTILVDMPAKEDRRRYLQLQLGKNKTHQVTDRMIEQLAGRSAGLSLANLAAIVETAGRNALKRNEPLSDAILEEAFELSRHGEKKDWGEAYMERVARHESGHAFLCYLAGRTPSYLTIVARGNHGGYMEDDSGESSPLETKEELTGRLRTALGGRAAEIAYYGEKDGLSTGASGDLSSAANIARAMICSYGMDEETGYLVLSPGEAVKGPMAVKISGRVSEIIKNELAVSLEIIRKEKKRLDRLVKALLEKNRLDKAEMEELLK